LTCGRCQFCRIGKTNLCPHRRSIGSIIDGGFAEYMIIPEDNLHVLPDTIDYDEGALAEPLACCVRAVLEMGSIRAGESVLVIGPGTIGLLCIQLAKLSGAQVSVMGRPEDEQRLRLAVNLGADHIFTTDDLDSVIAREPGFQTAIECSGSVQGFDSAIKLVKKDSKIIQMGLTGKPVLVPTDSIALKEVTIVGTFAHNWSTWNLCIDLMSQGKLHLKPIITNVFPLEDYLKAFEAFRNREGVKILLQPGK
jgi:L-iditol 2-dehydrogenase